MTMPGLAAGTAELQQEAADQLLDQLVDAMDFAVVRDRITLPAEGSAEAWIEAQAFADLARTAYLGALERVRVMAGEA